MKTCTSCKKEQHDEAFEVCNVIAGKVYRRRKCQKCKRAITNLRRNRLRAWLNDYKKNLACERCGFADYCALEFHHHRRGEKDFNVADMIRSGFSIDTMRREIQKCIVLFSNCHQIEHYEKHH